MLKIGLTMRVVENDTYPEKRDAIANDWPIYLNSVFQDAIIVPILNQPGMVEKIFNEIDLAGVILSNGNDLGESPERDETENLIVAHCIRKNLPIFGVCRGFQVLNVIFNGSLEKSLARLGKDGHVAKNHLTRIINDKFGKLINKNEIEVNSYHNQGVIVEGLSKELNAFAVTNNVVEGFFHPNKPIMAIQWHPERVSPSVIFDKEIILRFFKEGVFWG